MKYSEEKTSARPTTETSKLPSQAFLRQRSKPHLLRDCGGCAGTKKGGEEFICAQMLDSLNDKVEFWIRNVAQHVNSFRLPVASGFFYPDFVAKLKDGRIFVVEYKGEHLAGAGNDDTNEKRLVGALWEKASSGNGLFAMIEKNIDGRDPRRQLIEKIEDHH